MGKLEFCRNFVYLDGRPITFEDRPYLPAIYASQKRNLVLRCSRQTEKSTFLANTIIYEACTNPGISMLFVAPRLEQARTFCHSRLVPCLKESPLVRRNLLRATTHPPITNMAFENGSQLYVRAAFLSADSCRGLSVRRLFVDEYQDIAPNNLAVLQETLSHAKDGRTFLTGTPKLIDNHLEGAFSVSTANEWTITCQKCNKGVILDQRCLGSHGIVCPKCQKAIDPRNGAWIPRNPQSAWGDGFWICHPMVPWLNYDEILERQRVYELARFKNECLGLPSSLGDHVVTRAELELCSEKYAMASAPAHVPPLYRDYLIAGLDWGGGGTSRTVLVLGFMRTDFKFQIVRMERFAAQEEPNRILAEVAQRCQHFNVRLIAADGGGNGYIYNRLLHDKLSGRGILYAILYSESGQAPRPDGVLWKWTVGRSRSLGGVFSRIKKQMIIFPNVRESGSFLDEFACELFQYDDDQRSGRFTHPETMPDDALHATNYALLVGVRGFQGQKSHMEDYSDA
jgi:hypothetical protein